MPPRPRGGGLPSPRGATQPRSTSAPLEQKLIGIARIVFLATEVQQAIRHMRKMRPDSPAVLKAAAKWYTASKHVGDSHDELRGAYLGLMGYWEGPAFDAFKDYMKDDVLAAAQRNEETLFEIGNALIDVHNTVVEHYNAAVTLFGETLSRAIELHGEWLVAKEETKPAWEQQLANCLALFVRGVVERRKDVYDAVASQAAAMTALRGRVQQIRAPGRVPAGVRQRSGWKNA